MFSQGYKFNIFFPDLIDKNEAPTYGCERDPDAVDGATCILRFHAGPPYEDTAFRIVNKVRPAPGKCLQGCCHLLRCPLPCRSSAAAPGAHTFGKQCIGDLVRVLFQATAHSRSGMRLGLWAAVCMMLSKASLCYLERRLHTAPNCVLQEWEYSHKKGFKSTFERGILHLYFNFKRARYRR